MKKMVFSNKRIIDRRLSSTVTFHTLQEVVNDTLYRELHFHTLIQIAGVVGVVMVIGAFHNKFVKNNDLPLVNRQKKLN